MLRGAARYPIATTGRLMVVALCFGATLDDLINDIGGWISTFQTLIVGALRFRPSFMASNKSSRTGSTVRADRRFALATRLEAIKAIEAYANKTAVNISCRQRRPKQPRHSWQALRSPTNWRGSMTHLRANPYAQDCSF